MKELTIEQIVPLLTSPVWYKRIVGEYYELIIRRELLNIRIQTLNSKTYKMHPDTERAMQTEIDMLNRQFSIMSLYEDVLYRRIVRYGIPFVDILSEVWDAANVLDGGEEP